MRIRFLEDAEMRNSAGAVVECYRAGEVHDLRDDRARRWLRRSKAERAPEPAPEPTLAALMVGEQGPEVVVAPAVEIPADWAALHWRRQAAIAERIVGRPVPSKAEAVAVIEAEIALRQAWVKPERDSLVSVSVAGGGGGSPGSDAGFASAQSAFRDKALSED